MQHIIHTNQSFPLEERELIRLAGHERCIAKNNIEKRAKIITDHYDELMGSNA